MIIVEVYYRAKPGMRDKIIELAKPNVDGSRKEKGNISYTHYASIENDQDMFVFERWENPDALRAHSKTEHHMAFSAARRPLLEEGSFKMTVYDATENVEITQESAAFVKKAIN